MAVHLSIGRISSISLLALLALAVAAGTAHYLSRSGPEPATAPASQIAVAVPSPAVPAGRRSDAVPTEAVALVPLPAEAEPEVAVAVEPEVEVEPEIAVEVAVEPEVAFEVAAEPEVAFEVVVEPKLAAEAVPEARAETEPAAVVAPVAEVEVAPAPAAARAVPPAAAPAADAVQIASVPVTDTVYIDSVERIRAVDGVTDGDSNQPRSAPTADARRDEAGPVVAPVAAPEAAPAAVPQGRVTVARLGIARQGSPAPRDLAVSASRPKNMAPIPTRAPRAATAGAIAVRSAKLLFQSGAEIRIKKDANLYITARNIPENDPLLEAYNADRPNRGRVRTRFGEATAAPGLLGIAAQAHRAQGRGQGNPAYSLADAMRDAIWRKTTAARLKSLTTAQNACAAGAGDTAKRAPSIGLIASC